MREHGVRVNRERPDVKGLKASWPETVAQFQPPTVVMNRAHDSDAIRHPLADQPVKAVILANQTHKQPIPYVEEKDKWREEVESFFIRI